MFSGERDGLVYVNSAQGNRTVEEAFFALGSAVGSNGAVPKAVLLARVEAETGERPPSDETVFGQVAVRRYVAARLAVMTRHGDYTPQGVGKLVRGWTFISYAAGLHWSCTSSLDTAVASHLAVRVEQWKANLRATNTGRE